RRRQPGSIRSWKMPHALQAEVAKFLSFDEVMTMRFVAKEFATLGARYAATCRSGDLGRVLAQNPRLITLTTANALPKELARIPATQTKLEELSIHRVDVTSSLSKFGRLAKLHTLKYDHRGEFTDDELQSLARLPSLRHLVLYCKVRADGLERLG